jgi:hypothetical protein
MKNENILFIVIAVVIYYFYNQSNILSSSNISTDQASPVTLPKVITVQYSDNLVLNNISDNPVTVIKDQSNINPNFFGLSFK